MFKFIALLFIAAVVIGKAQADEVNNLHKKLGGDIDSLTKQAQGDLQKDFDKQDSKTSDLKKQVDAKKLDAGSCAAEVSALAVTKNAQIDAINALGTAKHAVLDTIIVGYEQGDATKDTKIGTLNTFDSTLPGYKTAADNLVIADRPVYILAAEKVNGCYEGLLNKSG